jgi:tetratricopeptide (TPR) repeat protein
MSQELFDEADRLEEAGDAEAALKVWQRLAEACPTRNVFLRLANLTEHLGLLDDAEYAFKRALEIDGRCVRALSGLGSLALDRRDYERAVDYLEASCQIQEDPAQFSLLGIALHHTARNVAAEAAYRRAIQIDPKYEEAYFNLGVLFESDRPSEAEALFLKALELDPDYACAYRELGFLLNKRGARREAESHLRKALLIEPGDAWARVYLGTCLWRLGDADSARTEFECAKELAPEWSVPLWSLGNVYELAFQDFDAAQLCFQRALEVGPDDQVALRNLGRLFQKRGQFELANEYLERAQLLDPEDQRIQSLPRRSQ